MSVLDALTSEHVLRRILAMLVVMLFVGVPTYIGSRIVAGISVQRDTAVLEARMRAVEVATRTKQLAQEDRFRVIEAALFGRVASELNAVNAQQEQDEAQHKAQRQQPQTTRALERSNAELRQRVTQLELWRYATSR